MIRTNIDIIWKEAFNQRNTKYKIKDILLSDACSCVYLLEDGNELRITVNTRTYHFSKLLLSKRIKHIAKVFDCFKMTLPCQYEDEDNVFCIVCERLYREFEPRPTVQSAINVFRSVWSEYLGKVHRLEWNPDVSIENAYVLNDKNGKQYLLDQLKYIKVSNVVKNIVLALHDSYSKIKSLDANSQLFLYPENIGMSDDNIIKMCNISHDYVVLDDNYEIDCTKHSVTITYNPVINDDFIPDNRMLMPLKIDFGDGHLNPVLGQIDTGATCSVFTKSFYERASLEYLGDTKVHGATGNMDAVKTRCLVEFPNGYKTVLTGATMMDFDDVSVLIGMDLLSKCKFQSEIYGNGFKYKLSFRN